MKKFGDLAVGPKASSMTANIAEGSGRSGQAEVEGCMR